MALDSKLELSRRAAMGTLAASALGFAVLGPRPRSVPDDGRVVLTYWDKWVGYEADAMRDVVEAFNASQDRIWVRFLSVDRLDQKARIAIGGGDPPDILGAWTHNLAEYAESGVIIPITRLARQAGLADGLFADPFHDMMWYRGERYAIVSSASSVALYYNRELFDAVGLDPEHPPATIPELIEASKRLAVTSSRGTIERLGFHPLEPPWWIWSWWYFNGSSVWDAERGVPTIDTPENIALIDELYRGFVEPYGVRAVERFLDGNGPYNSVEYAFLNGRVGMVMQGAFLANVIDRYNPDLDYAVSPFPVGAHLAGQRRAVVEADLLMIPSGTRHPDAAMEFIAFTQRPRWAESVAAVHRKFSAHTEVSEAFVRGHPNRFIELHRDLALDEHAFHIPITPIWPEVLHELTVAFRQVLAGRAPAAEAFASAQKRAEAQAARLERQRRLRSRRAPAHGTGA